ncbi:hypothetical protein ACIA98_07870 [Streptomyces sp. NPDC051366]|uniref:hypothetical protein n=1 Tax=Streptomyces sp. NPDC051366 TaxID=3365652 RepID=UPI0037A693C8
MRARLLLTGVALGAAVLVGGAATAQAAPAPLTAGTASSPEVQAMKRYPGKFTYSQCISLRDSYAGYAYCDALGGGWYALWVES